MSAKKSQRRAQMKGTEEEIGAYAGLPGQIVIYPAGSKFLRPSVFIMATP